MQGICELLAGRYLDSADVGGRITTAAGSTDKIVPWSGQLKRPFELHGILQTFPIVRVRSECIVFFRGFGHERRRPGALYARDAASTRHQLPVGQW